MKTAEPGRGLIQGSEDCRLKAYPDPLTGKGPWTCGWGTTGASVGPDTTWTQQYADERFDESLAEFERMANDAIEVELTQNQFDAFLSILYNVGPGGKHRDGIIILKSGRPSTLLRFINERQFEQAGRQFLQWDSPGSSVQHGLHLRRMREKALWDTP